MDPQLEEAIKIVCQYDRVATSLLQRKLSIGYARAAKLMEVLAELGVITKAEGANVVDVLIKDPEAALTRFKKDPSGKMDKWRLFLFVLLIKISDWTKALAYKILILR